ncbi:radical SAM domain protein [Tissierellia bacterium KA00581]|nr:radical SAM domain protein [Tissierellia bacterium KA00581]
MKNKKYLFIDIDDYHYENRIYQIDSDLYEQYITLLNESKNFKIDVDILRFSKLYGKFDYKISNLFKTIDKFVVYILNLKNLKFLNIHINYRNLLFALLIAEKVKNINKNIFIIFSGQYMKTLDFSEIKIVDYIDFVCTSKSCIQSFCKLNRSKFLKLNKVDTLEKIKFEYKVFDNINLLREVVNIKVGEGCLFNCHYCTFKNFYSRYHQMNFIEIIDIMNKYNLVYGTNRFIFNHELFICDNFKLKNFCYELINNKYIFKWSCSTRIEFLNFENINLLKNSGCDCLFIGLESGSKVTQKKMNKNIKIDNILYTIELLSKSNINAIFSFIYKYPTETREDLIETFKLMFKIKTIEIKNKKSIFMYELSKINFFPNTLITHKYYDRLNFDIYKNYDILYYPNEIVKFIENNKKIFTNYFNLSENISELYVRFNEFVLFIFKEYIYIYYNKVREIFEKYSYDILSLYAIILENYRDEVYEILDKNDNVNIDNDKNEKFNKLVNKIL